MSPLSIELHVLRDLLMHKYGREFSAAVVENKDGCVSERVRVNSIHYPLSPSVIVPPQPLIFNPRLHDLIFCD
jgi:hypothetical protein